MNWHIKTFESLTNKELYEVLKIRNEVFIIEQNCHYLDLDNKDYKAHHIFCINSNEEIAAYARLLPNGISYPQASIGRVATAKRYRRHKLGIDLMKKSINFIFNNYKTDSIKISAQTYLIEFYKKFGFKTSGEAYFEDEIPHIAMILEKPNYSFN
jgi:ElaA protein